MIEEGLSRAGDGAELAFYGGSFTAIEGGLRRAYLEAAFPYVQHGRISSVRISTRPDAIDEGILSELTAFGVQTIELGAQSMDNRVLALSERGHTAEDTVNASKLIKEKGFNLILQMMVGLPGENPGDPMNNAEAIAALNPDGVRIYPAAVIKDTQLEQLWRQGKYAPLELENAVQICAGLIRYFEERSIPVIRAGLNPSEDLEKSVLAGIYHPAFGELSRSRIMLEQAWKALSENAVKPGSSVILGTDRGKISLLVGQHRTNIEMLKTEFRLKEIKVRELDSKSTGSVRCDADKFIVEILEVY
jgi:histone acetyltransferase (RNA polymerase elongator complex component)